MGPFTVFRQQSFLDSLEMPRSRGLDTCRLSSRPQVNWDISMGLRKTLSSQEASVLQRKKARSASYGWKALVILLSLLSLGKPQPVYPGILLSISWAELIACFSLLAAAAAAKSLQSCPTLSDPMDWSPTRSSIHGTFQARVLEWGAIAFSVSLLTYYFGQAFFHHRPYCIILFPLYSSLPH